MQISDNPFPTILLEHLHEWFSLVNDTSGPFILEGHLTPDYYLHFLLDELPLLLEDIPLQASLKLVAATQLHCTSFHSTSHMVLELVLQKLSDCSWRSAFLANTSARNCRHKMNGTYMDQLL
jgi:hypothetical protein